MLVGSSALISKARAWRKMLGGGMRQAGILAAAGIYALDHQVERLADDHQNALTLARGLASIKEVTQLQEVQTNMLFIQAENSGQLVAFLKQRNILVSANWMFRLVTHLDINADDIQTVIAAFEEFYKTGQK